jgi:hypothetical protein
MHTFGLDATSRAPAKLVTPSAALASAVVTRAHASGSVGDETFVRLAARELLIDVARRSSPQTAMKTR